jgi:fructan beta-fructosidase
MNDPNGLVYFDGEYHLFYQYNPHGNTWGHMSWGHAVSTDLLTWQHLPLALPEADNVMIFSGSAVVDWQNTTGFGTAGQPPLVAIYTGHYTKKPLQNQHLAYSTDRGRTWTKFAGNPVLDANLKDFRDPKVSWHAATQRWVMTVAWPDQRKVRFYASPNLKEWTHLSDFGPAGSTQGIWECPDLFPLRVDDQTKWVLLVNVGGGAPAGGSGGQYFVGDFDGQKFTAAGSADAQPLWFDYGPDCYATITWADVPAQDGRRLALGWMSNWQYANQTPTNPWRSAMTVPRELGLVKTPAGYRLTQSPVRELTQRHSAVQTFAGGTMASASAWLQRTGVRGRALDVQVELEPQGTSGLKLLVGTAEETIVGVDAEKKQVFIDRSQSGNVRFHKSFVRPCVAPLPTGKLRLRVLVDACSVEVFVNEGQPTLTALTFPSVESQGVSGFGPARIANLRVATVQPRQP